MHVAVTRPHQTDSEGLKLPIVYVSSPYFAGTAPFVDGLFWDVKHELGEAAKNVYMWKLLEQAKGRSFQILILINGYQEDT